MRLWMSDIGRMEALVTSVPFYHIHSAFTIQLVVTLRINSGSSVAGKMLQNPNIPS